MSSTATLVGLYIGDQASATGVMNIGTQSGGNGIVYSNNASVFVGNGNNPAAATLNLNSGTFVLSHGSIESASNSSSTVNLNLNGGVLRAGANNLVLISNSLSTAGHSVNVYNGGAIFDPNGNTATVAANLLATVGDGIYPSGGTLAVSGGSGYIGQPLVGLSGGSGFGAMAIATITNGTISGVTLTCPGEDYQPGDILTLSFSGGGASSPAGNYQYTLQSGDVAANGAGGLTKTDSGLLILTGANTYSGNTTISAGTLAVNGTTSSAGSIQVSGGASLTGTGSVGSVTVLSGGNVTAGQNGVGTLTLNSLTLGAQSGDTATINVYNLLNVSPGTLQVNGSVTASGGSGSVTIDVNSDPGLGTYKLIGYYGTLTGFSALTVSVAGLVPHSTATLLNNSGEVDLQIQATSSIWSGAASTAWNTSNVQNWKLSTTNSATNYIEGDIVVFDDSAATNNVVSISSANVNPAAVYFENNSIHYQLQGSMGIAGSTNVTVNGGGGVTIATSNSYTGGTTIQNGTFSVANANAIPSGAAAGNVVLGGNAAAILDLNGTPLVSINGLSGGLASFVGQVINSGTGTSTLNLGLGDATAVFSGIIADNNGSGGQVALVKNGSGTETLSGPNTFSGPTTVNNGTLVLNNNLALQNSVLNIGGSGSVILASTAGAAIVFATAPTVAGLQGSGNVSLPAAANILIVGNNSAGSTFSGAISGLGSLALIGSGSLTFTGANNYSGTTVIAGGTVNYAGGASSGGNGSLIVGGLSTIGVMNITSNGNFAFVGNSSIGGVINVESTTGAGAIKQSSGSVVLNKGGDLYLGAGGSSGDTGTYGSYVLSGGALTATTNAGMGEYVRLGYYGMGVFTQSGGVFTEPNYFTMSGYGIGLATFTGGSAVIGSYGGVRIGGQAGGVGVMNIGTEAGGNAVVSVQGNNNISLAVGGASASATLNLDSGTLATTTAINNPSGSATAVVNFDGATLQASANPTTLIDNTPSSVNVYNGGVVFDTNGNKATVSANLLATSGDGIYPSGGTLAASGGSGYIGAPLVGISGGSGFGATAIATISNGAITNVTLTCPGQNYLPGDILTFSFSGGGTLTPAGTFQYTLEPADVSANLTGGVTKVGIGTLFLSGANTYSGPTTIDAGVLQLGSTAALGTGSLAVNGGTLDLDGYSVTVASFSGAAGVVTNTGSNSLATLNVSQSNVTVFNGSIRDGSGQTALAFTGPGTLILIGSNNYSGGTYVGDGTLILDSPSALAAGSSLTVGQDASSIFAPALAGPSIAAVPEPGTILLLVAAFWSAVACRRFSRRPLLSKKALLVENGLV